MLLEVITHCWQYAPYLAWQLASFARFPPRRNQFTITVCYCPDDVRTAALVEHYAGVWQRARRVRFTPLVLSQAEVCNRAIGRHLAAVRSGADWLWFSDCDYCVGHRTIDRICDKLAALPPAAKLAFPRAVRRNWPAQAMALAAHGGYRALDLPELPVQTFQRSRCCCLTPGAMFARGCAVREKGYPGGTSRVAQAFLKPAAAGEWQASSADGTPTCQRRANADVYFKHAMRAKPYGFYARWLYRISNG